MVSLFKIPLRSKERFRGEGPRRDSGPAGGGGRQPPHRGGTARTADGSDGTEDRGQQITSKLRKIKSLNLVYVWVKDLFSVGCNFFWPGAFWKIRVLYFRETISPKASRHRHVAGLKRMRFRMSVASYGTCPHAPTGALRRFHRTVSKNSRRKINRPYLRSIFQNVAFGASFKTICTFLGVW